MSDRADDIYADGSMPTAAVGIDLCRRPVAVGIDRESGSVLLRDGCAARLKWQPLVGQPTLHGLQGAVCYWVQPVGDGSMGYIQPVRMAVT